jgi:uncharacterized RDD family membrane protein YckC
MAYRSIEIETPQNVVISYELASGMQRVLATLLDAVISLGISLVITLIFSFFAFSASLNALFIGQLITFIIGYFYHLISESTLNGRSIGKMAVGIRVIKTSGEPLKFSDYFLRWVLRIVDITITLGSLGLILIFGTERRQRLGDIMAGTAVIVNKQSVNFSLRDILKMHQELTTQNVSFPEVKHIDEKHLLYIKNLLNGRTNYTQTVYKNAIYEAADIMSELLKFDCPPGKEEAFLNKLVSDYIALTR